MKISRHLTLGIIALMLAACSHAPEKGPCTVEVYSPNPQFSEVRLLDTRGMVLDSTLTLRNDSVIFTRTDTAAMPYVATLRLRNPESELDVIYMPIVIEGGTIELSISNPIELKGTDDNKHLFEFLKAKNNLIARLNKEGADPDKHKAELSQFYAQQAILNKDNIVGTYIYESYASAIQPEDLLSVKQAIENK